MGTKRKMRGIGHLSTEIEGQHDKKWRTGENQLKNRASHNRACHNQWNKTQIENRNPFQKRCPHLKSLLRSIRILRSKNKVLNLIKQKMIIKMMNSMTCWESYKIVMTRTQFHNFRDSLNYLQAHKISKKTNRNQTKKTKRKKSLK